MTRMTPAAAALVKLAGDEWVRHKAFLLGLEARIRAEVEAAMEVERHESEMKVSAALQVAVNGGATRNALKAVTTKDHTSFHHYLSLATPKPDVADAVEEAASAAVDFTIAWEDATVLRISLDPANVPSTKEDRTDAAAWDGLFDVLLHDGKVFVMQQSVKGGFEVGAGVEEWLRADERNLARVVEWIGANTQ